MFTPWTVPGALKTSSHRRQPFARKDNLREVCKDPPACYAPQCREQIGERFDRKGRAASGNPPYEHAQMQGLPRSGLYPPKLKN